MELNPSVLEILKKRGIETEEEITEFLSDKPQKTYDPFLLHDMEAGVDLILSTIENEGRICIYGDYDTDGVTSVALLRDVLKELGAKVSYYIPSRFDEGYGLNNSALDKIKEAGTDLVVTVDCGCTSVNEVEHAKEIGLDILITDHHSIRNEIPDCLIIDPQHPDCRYPFKFLAGVGVAFKLAQALVETAGLSKTILTRNLDLVGIGTIGDIVPLIDENRTLAKYGLRALNITERIGLKALIEKTGLKPGEINSRRVSFVIVPHINAAGRMDDATLAARLMQTKESEKAEEMAEKLLECNTRRRSTQEELVEKSEEILRDEWIREPDRKFIFIKLEEAHEGVIGIVAGRLKERYKLPSIIVTSIEDGYYKGTGRSPDGINLFKLLDGHSDLFVRFGGHAAACGFTIEEKKIPELIDVLKKETEALYNQNEEVFKQKAVAEVHVGADDVSFDFVRQQEKLEPFGKNNPRPLVEVNLISANPSRMGQEGQYLRVDGKLENQQNIRCLDFKNADNTESKIKEYYSDTNNTSPLKVIGYIESQEWNGREYIQMNIEDIYY